ncbi:putative PH domain-containing protein PB16A4.02c [Daldinia childiae]|uniref:putative PH domain-containing protein PB16A4.02c n=1 Tax=Daldinia childiae TaxID=326645 RepID=UPI001448935B|nr:putative PH domain-containing protein PB16A4.02c [Daldinia childiae]KAF3064665.1 putative PH domain-containing protein PB16A4.02c [Daldinia childiae]
MAAPANPSQINRLRNQFAVPMASPVNQNGSFEFDRVLKSGYVQKRTQKTKTWKSVYLVLRPSALSIYKTDKESKLRHKLWTSELSAVTLLKDPKNKRHNLFGLFSPSRNYHFEAPNAKDAQEWVDLIKIDAKIEEEEEEMFLASPIIRRQTFAPVGTLQNGSGTTRILPPDHERLISSSPEPIDPRSSRSAPSTRRLSHNDYSGLSGNELASHSDISDNEGRAQGASIESLSARSPATSGTQIETSSNNRPILGDRNASQLSGLNLENDPDRIVWQGWLWLLNSKRGVKQWKNRWAVLRPRNLILYKDESEYKASFILSLSGIVNVVDINPISKTKSHCFQVITDEKTYRYCAHDEETLVHCLGAFKSLLSKRRELEARAAASGNVAPPNPTVA